MVLYPDPTLQRKGLMTFERLCYTATKLTFLFLVGWLYASLHFKLLWPCWSCESISGIWSLCEPTE